MAADYRHIGGVENRLGRHYSQFSPFSLTPALADQSLARRKLWNPGSNRRSRVRRPKVLEGASIRGRLAAVVVFGREEALGLRRTGSAGHRPRGSSDLARQAAEGEMEDVLVGGARRQVDLDLPLQFDNPRGDLDQA